MSKARKDLTKDCMFTLTTKDIADRLGITTEQVIRLVDRERHPLKAINVSQSAAKNRSFRFSESDFDSWVQEEYCLNMGKQPA